MPLLLAHLQARIASGPTRQSRGTAQKLRFWVPSALRAPAAPHFHVSCYEHMRISKLATELDDPDSKMIEQFIDDAALRDQMLNVLSKFSIHLISGFVTFLNRCIDETWARSSSYGAFEGYNQNLKIILDILTAFPIHKFPPALFQTVAYALHRVSPFVGPSAGQSWSAHNTWVSRRGELTKETLAELRSLAVQHKYSNLELLLHDVDV